MAIWGWGGEHFRWKEQVSKAVRLEGAWNVQGIVKELCVVGLTVREEARNQIMEDQVILSVMKSLCRVWSRDVLGVMLFTMVLGELRGKVIHSLAQCLIHNKC